MTRLFFYLRYAANNLLSRSPEFADTTDVDNEC
jgi:hypothetical protein